jgi:hypothetical protein
MKKSFVESTGFTEWIASQQESWDRVLAVLQQDLMKNPEAGDVMPGCGGLRKIRTGDPARRKGKRGGVRVIYLNIPEANWIYLIDVFDKGEKDDLTPAEKKALTRLVSAMKVEAIASSR